MRLARLHGEIADLSAKAPGRLGIAAIDGSRYTRFTARADEPFALGGVAALPVAVLAYRRADQHKLKLDNRIELSAEDLRYGTSDIEARHPHGGASYTYAQLIDAMLLDGDDTASDAVLAAVGGPAAITAFLTHANLAGFDFRKTRAQTYNDALAHRSFAHGGDNGGTPNGVANLLLGLTNQTYLRLDAEDELMQLLSESRFPPGGLRAGFPANAEFAHVAGDAASARATDATSDAGILTFPDGRRIAIAAFLGDSTVDRAARDALFALVGRTIYRAYVP